MRSRASTALVQPIAVVAVVLTAFAVLVGPFREFETAVAADLLHMLGVAADRVQLRPNSSLGVYPYDAGPFLAIVTPSCSSLSAVLAVAALSVFVPRRLRRRRYPALALALLCVVAGNVIRIASSVGIGLLSGTNSLVLFHDWVGSLFAFAYTVGGYLLMLFLLLSAARRSDAGPSTMSGADAVEVGPRAG